MNTAATVPGHRTWLPGVSLVVAAGAAALGVFAIASDDVAPAPEPPPAAEIPADDPAVGMRLPEAGEPCGLRIRGNLPC